MQPIIRNENLISATWKKLAIRQGALSAFLQFRDGTATGMLRFAEEGPYQTIFPSSAYQKDNIVVLSNGIDFWIQSDKDTVLEIEEWF